MNYFFGKNRNSLVNERTSYTPTSSPKVSPRKLNSDSEFLLKPPSKEIFENLKKESLSETKEWNSVHSSSDLKIWFRKSNDAPINMVKLQSHWNNMKPKDLYNMILDDDFNLKLADDYFDQWKLVEKIDNQNDISYCKKSKKFH